MPQDVDKYLEKAWKGELLDELALKALCLALKDILIREENTRILSAPISMVGDIHGQFFDLQELFKIGGKPPYTNYLFLGDYVDRGGHSVEVITQLSLIKLKYPERVTLIRGNHETRNISQNYGFYMECQTKFGQTAVWDYFTDMFDFLPIAAQVDNTIFCVHGGLSPNIETLSEISEINRFQEIPQEGPFIDLMWSDPDPESNGFSVSPRGAGFYFGKDIVNKFLHANNLSRIVRAHQLCMEGFRQDFDGQLATVWSAPNYCYRFQNVASILEVGSDLSFTFNLFTEAPESEKIAQMQNDRTIQDKIDNIFFN